MISWLWLIPSFIAGAMLGGLGMTLWMACEIEDEHEEMLDREGRR